MSGEHREAVWDEGGYHPGYGKGVCEFDGQAWPCKYRTEVRAAAVAIAPKLSDLRDAICFVDRHEHLSTTSYCNAGRAQAYRIREALIARYQYRADPSEAPA